MRTGNFNSSTISALLAMGSREMTPEELEDHKKLFPKSKKKNIESWPGEAALTYIEECNMERRLGRTLDNEINSKETTWGNLVEEYVFDQLSLEYSTISKQTIVHPDYDFWSGTPDSICYGQENTVVDIKSPFTLKSFCQLVDSWHRGGIQAIRDTHKQGDKYYYQIVSNACLTGCNWGELIVFVPYKSELEAIKKLAAINGGAVSWLNYATDNDIPWLPDGGHYKSLNKFRFPIPEEDKTALTNRVIEAGKLLVKPQLIAVSFEEFKATHILNPQ